LTVVRLEEPSDIPAIRKVHLASFAADDEAQLVESLRGAGHLTVSLVAEIDGAVVGHVAFSPVSGGAGAVGLGLAPLAVLSGWRRHGVGGELVTRGLERCASLGFGWAVVLGDPGFYSRFGFRAGGEFDMTSEYGSGPSFQVIELERGSLLVAAGRVRYGPEFTSLG